MIFFCDKNQMKKVDLCHKNPLKNSRFVVNCAIENKVNFRAFLRLL